MDQLSKTSGQARSFTTPQVVLGLFILGQIAFLVTANLLGPLRYYRPKPPGPDAEVGQVIAPGWPAQEGHVHDLVETIKGLTDRYGHVTGQPQDWGLFAPTVAAECPFVAVELRWEAEGEPADPRNPPELLLSVNEPPDVRSYFRWKNFRLRKFESYLEVVLKPYENETPEEQARRWRSRIEEHLRAEWHAVGTYLAWRKDNYLKLHAARPAPQQLILHVRRYHIPAPHEGRLGWDGPFMEPLARWRPDTDPPADCRPLEQYDPVTRRFEWLHK